MTGENDMTKLNVPVVVMSEGSILGVYGAIDPRFSDYALLDYDLLESGECPVCVELCESVNSKVNFYPVSVQNTSMGVIEEGGEEVEIAEGTWRTAWLGVEEQGEWYCPTCDINWTQAQFDPDFPNTTELKAIKLVQDNLTEYLEKHDETTKNQEGG
jgi:hypothetical protein